MMRKRVLIAGLLLAMVFVSGCVEKGVQQEIAQTGEREEVVEEENVLSVTNEASSLSGAPTGAYRVNLSLSGAPALNKPVKATIDVYMPYTPFSNTTVSISLWEGASLDKYERRLIFEEELWKGVLIGSRLDEKFGLGWENTGRWNPLNITGNYTIRVEYDLRINKTGMYTLIGTANGSGRINVYLFINVTEKATLVNQKPFPRPPQPVGEPGEYRPLDLDLKMLGVPKLNNTVELIATVIPHVDENSVNVPFDPKNTTFTVFLPDGFELIKGELAWNGNLSGKKLIQLRATVKAVKTGDWQISLVPLEEKPFAVGCAFNGYMDVRISEEEGWQRFGKGGCIFVRVTNETGEVSDLPLPALPPPPKPTTEPRAPTPEPYYPPKTEASSILPLAENKSYPASTVSSFLYPPLPTSPPVSNNSSG